MLEKPSDFLRDLVDERPIFVVSAMFLFGFVLGWLV